MTHSASQRLCQIVGAVGLLALASGCASAPRAPVAGVPVTPADNYKVTLNAVDESLDLPVTAATVSLDAANRQALREFAAAYRTGGSGAMEILNPTGAGNTIAAQALANEARDFLIEQGIHPIAVVIAPYNAANQSDAPLLLTFSRTVASVPDCPPIWQENLARTANNQPWSSFGCATVNNIANLIADPNDLRRPRDMTAADAARRQVVIDKYRKGEVTGATRGSSERVTVSNVVR
jgi:pilus assembly protein CpaD